VKNWFQLANFANKLHTITPKVLTLVKGVAIPSDTGHKSIRVSLFFSEKAEEEKKAMSQLWQFGKSLLLKSGTYPI